MFVVVILASATRGIFLTFIVRAKCLLLEIGYKIFTIFSQLSFNLCFLSAFPFVYLFKKSLRKVILQYIYFFCLAKLFSHLFQQFKVKQHV